MFFDGDIAADDQTAEQGGVQVVVDPASAQLLVGATLDYKDGLQEAGFSDQQPERQPHLRLRQQLQLIRAVERARSARQVQRVRSRPELARVQIGVEPRHQRARWRRRRTAAGSKSSS